MSSSYNTLGGERPLPRSEHLRALALFSSELVPIRLRNLTDRKIVKLRWFLAGCEPQARISDFHVTAKKEPQFVHTSSIADVVEDRVDTASVDKCWSWCLSVA